MDTSATKWQEGIEQVREIWMSDDENPFRKMFKDQPGICPGERKLREVRELEAVADSDDENAAKKEDIDDDPEGLCEADISSLTPVQKLLRAHRKKKRRDK